VNINLLGPVTLSGNGSGFHSIRAKKVRGLLSVLALSPRAVLSFDELVDELWPGTLLHNPRNALQANVLRLRKQLEAFAVDGGVCADEALLTYGSGYVLNVPSDAVDADRFERLAAKGDQMIKRDPREAADLLGNALKLWRGPALTDVGDGIRCRAAAVKLTQRRLSVQVSMIEARLELGRDQGIVADLTELVMRYPEHERLSELLMLALYRCGRQTEALDVFHQTRQWLIRELGAEPSRALRSMYQSILVQELL
jgi:DNA-binding SARP family transcriptional activator